MSIFSLQTFLTMAIATTFALPTQARLPRLNADEIAQKVDCDQRGEKADVCRRIVKRHLVRDVKYCQIDPDFVKQAPTLLKAAGKKEGRVLGHNAYLGFFPGRYSYGWRLTDDGGIEINANVHFNNNERVSDTVLAQMQEKLNQAAMHWQSANPFAFPLTFRFNVAGDGDRRDVRAKLLVGKYTRGPYFLSWSSIWGHTTVAHEMGHVMGLDDEYSNTPFRSLNYCDRNSMMCTSGTPYPYHYYMILRRLMCRL